MAVISLPTSMPSPSHLQTRRTMAQSLQRHGLLIIFSAFVLLTFLFSGHGPARPLTTWKTFKENSWTMQSGRFRKSTWTAQSGPLPTTYVGEQHYAQDLLNSTLGFGKIVVLNLAHRHDKRDELSLMAKVSNLDLEFYHPLLPSELRHEGLPPHIGNKKGLNPPNESAFRGHADLWRAIALGDKETVLVLEDDIDWDIDMRESLKAMSAPLAQLAASETGSAARIGNDQPWQHQAWDVMFLGACVENDLWHEHGKKFIDTSRLPLVRYADERTPDFGRWSYDFTVNLPKYNVSQPGKDVVFDGQPRQRVLARAIAPACSAAYALTRAGAARLLYHVTRQYNGDTDVAMAKALVANYVKGMIMMPSLMGQWRIAKSTGNSDLHFSQTGTTLAEQLQAPHIFDPNEGDNRDVRNSTRVNLGRLVKNLKT